ncbi:ribonuclease R [Lachnoclostridium sp. Marseille-P6806]|uniref:ribonuclease R n=1 Tax=Lachnoclostridium sp. Marseille-P6806 TaxID=2364793 RepID=UPI0010308141|nr:ribonuclease R [Lachnoclostridium sp. Marseille-P6806]
MRGRKKAEYNTERRYTGVFQSNIRGFGFVVVEGLEQDLFVPAGRTGNAFYGDTVEVRVLGEKGGKRQGREKHRTEAEILRIAEHGVTRIVGTFRRDRGHGCVTPDNSRIPFDFHVAGKDSAGVADGDKVVLDITDYGSPARSPRGRITEVLGAADAPGVDILSIIRANGLPEEFPEEVRREAQRVPRSLGPSAPDGREDLRRLTMVTIDGEDTKDIDDAVSLERTEDGGCVLGVHIADVSHYVTEGSALDAEAAERGTSIYLADRVIPMLPRELSNGICSLNEGENRCALSCIMYFDAAGNRTGFRIAESVVRIDVRCSYNGVQRLFDSGDASELRLRLEGQHGGSAYRGEKTALTRIARMLRRMRKLSAVLTRKKEQRGAIDFAFPEAKIILDSKGRPTDIRPGERSEATELIENFMLAANESVAEFCSGKELPFVYRSHGAPEPEKVRGLLDFLRGTGLAKPGEDSVSSGISPERISPLQVRRILEEARGTAAEATLNRMALRSMQQARYTTECEGHFGLALRYYCHFTSPIRRYPDLQIHRIIKEFLHAQAAGRKKLAPERTEHYRGLLGDVARRSSNRERRADDAERQTEKLKKCEYMARFIGEEFEGTISGVTGWGLFVELENTCEGLLPVSCLSDDYYVFDEKSYILKGERRGRSYGLGQKLRIRVAAADTASRTVSFVPAENQAAERPGNRPAGKGHGRKRTGKAGRKQQKSIS